MNNLHGLQVFENQFDACDFQAEHLCSACWESLVNSPDGNGGYICRCVRCGENTRGYVTAKYVIRRIKSNEDQARIARQALSPYVPFLQERKRSTSENLSDLGF